jgi:hypothetical protein
LAVLIPNDPSDVDTIYTNILTLRSNSQPDSEIGYLGAFDSQPKNRSQPLVVDISDYDDAPQRSKVRTQFN